MEKDSENIFHNCNLTHCKKGPLITDTEAGEIMCGTCGIVLTEKTEDSGPEYHTYSKEDYFGRARVGTKSSLTIHDMGLSTNIHNSNRDAAGNLLSSEMKQRFSRLRIWDSRTKLRTRDRTMLKAFTMLDAAVTQLGLPNVVSEKAAYFYRKIVSKKSRTGKSAAALISSCLYAACRFTNTPRTLKDISVATNVPKIRLQKSFRDLTKTLDLNFEVYDPIEFIARLCSSVNTSEKTKRIAFRLLIKARKEGLITSKNPIGIAAAAVYFASAYNNEEISQAMLAKASGVTGVTIRNRYHELKNRFGVSPLDFVSLKQ